jgi:hypothetical protein
MFGHRDKKDPVEHATPNPDRAASSDDAGDEAQELTDWEQVEMQRRLQLETQYFEGGMEG